LASFSVAILTVPIHSGFELLTDVTDTVQRVSISMGFFTNINNETTGEGFLIVVFPAVVDAGQKLTNKELKKKKNTAITDRG
jgi:hypothetical protein